MNLSSESSYREAIQQFRIAHHDIQAAVQIHELHPLSFDTLIFRMKNEMTQVHGSKKHILENFLAMIEAVFGENSALKAQGLLESWEKR